MRGFELLGDVYRTLETDRSKVVNLGQFGGRGEEPSVDRLRVPIDEMRGRFGPEHDIDDLATLRAVRFECVAVTWAHEDQLPRFQRLGDPIDPMRGLPTFDQEDFKKVVVMRFCGKSSRKVLSGEMKGFFITNIAPHKKRFMFHGPILVKKIGA